MFYSPLEFLVCFFFFLLVLSFVRSFGRFYHRSFFFFISYLRVKPLHLTSLFGLRIVLYFFGVGVDSFSWFVFDLTLSPPLPFNEYLIPVLLPAFSFYFLLNVAVISFCGGYSFRIWCLAHSLLFGFIIV